LWGLVKAEIEFGLMVIGHNLRKLAVKAVPFSGIVHFHQPSGTILDQFETLFRFPQCTLVELHIEGKERTPFKNAA